MRSTLLCLVPLALLGCSSPAPPGEPSRPAPAEAAASDASAAPSLTDAAAPATRAVAPLYAAVAPAGETPPRMLNRYVMDILNRNQAGIDAAWAVAPPDARRADDAVLRVLSDVRNLRLDSDPPLPRDPAQPPRLLEVPVRVRAVTAQGQFRYHGWYRVQPRADGQGWQIHSAQLQPTLD